ncbi:MAG: hypothetical protein K0B01_00180 [Syntrophobacterales bacterium]|nr:hypothetical protein [Syntrophobacterales bacterium]
MQALFTLTSSEAKRLIGKAVAALPEIQQAKGNGYLVVSRGSTNAFILEELLGEKIAKERYAAGMVIKGVLCVLGQGLRTKPVVFHKGEILNVDPGAVIEKMTPGDLLLKGANAVDPYGNVGVAMAGKGGGTMGQFYMALKAMGVETIYPVGLEKLIPSVPEAAKYGGTLNLDKSIGAVVGMACVSDSRIFTEIEALDSLFGVEAIPFAAGGWGGAEGAVTLIVEGTDDDVNACMEFISGIKGEPPLAAVKGACKDCGIKCSFAGLADDKLPSWLR